MHGDQYTCYRNQYEFGANRRGPFNTTYVMGTKHKYKGRSDKLTGTSNGINEGTTQLSKWTNGAKGPTIPWASGPTVPTHGRRERWGNGETFEVDKAGTEGSWIKETVQTCNKDRRANVPIRWLW